MPYIDGFVTPVPAGNKDKYIAAAREASALFFEYGALQVVECWGDDVPDGKLTDFKMAVKAEPGEVICFSWIAWPSKEVRDAATTKMMNDPRMNMENAPFDAKRMIFGGFVPVLDVSSATGR